MQQYKVFEKLKNIKKQHEKEGGEYVTIKSKDIQDSIELIQKLLDRIVRVEDELMDIGLGEERR